MMKKSVKIWLILAAVFIVAGFMTFGVALSMINWDFSKLSTVKYEENTYEFDGQVKDISVKTDTAHVELLPSEEDGISVLCYEEKNARHTVTTEDGVLKIERSAN